MTAIKSLIACILLTACNMASADTRLNLQSDAGDYIGGGKSYLYTDSNATFQYGQNYDNGISLNITSGDAWWSLNLAAPGNARLKPGSYANAMRFPFQNDNQPGLDFSGSGRGCNQLSGRFDIFEVAYNGNGVVTALNATFEQHCENGSPALRGQISYNLVPPMGVTTTGMAIKAYVCQNNTSGQRLKVRTTTHLVDCKKLGLQTNPGDQITITVNSTAK